MAGSIAQIQKALSAWSDERKLGHEDVVSPLAGMYMATMPSAIGPSNALAVADAYACVRCLADSAASLPLIAYRRSADGQRTRLSSGRLVDLLTIPAPTVTQAMLVSQIVAHMCLWGNAYVGKHRNEKDVVHQVSLLDPARMKVEVIGGKPFYTYTHSNGESDTYDATDILHIRALSVDGVVGVSPVAQCRTAIGLSDTLTKRAQAFFDNDARPGGALKFNEHMDRQKARDVVKMWAQHHGGTHNAGLPAVLTGGAEWVNIGMPNSDAQFLESRQLSATEIARIFRVPPWMIGAGDGNRSITYANTQQQAEAFVKFSLTPWLTVIEQAITNDPDLSPKSVFVEFLLDNMLRGATQERFATYEVALRSGVLTVNECRRLENLPPLDTTTSPSAAPNGNPTNNAQGA